MRKAGIICNVLDDILQRLEYAEFPKFTKITEPCLIYFISGSAEAKVADGRDILNPANKSTVSLAKRSVYGEKNLFEMTKMEVRLTSDSQLAVLTAQSYTEVMKLVVKLLEQIEVDFLRSFPFLRSISY